MKKNNMIVDNLNHEIQAILTENEIEEYESHTIRNTLLAIKDKVLLISPIVLGTLTFITKNDTLFLLTSISVGTEITNMFFNYTYLNEKLLNKKEISSKEHEKYFNEDYKLLHDAYYEEYQDEIEESNIRNNINLVTDEYLNKEETKERLLFELDRYYDAYDLPKLYLNQREINELIDKSYQFFKNNNLEEKYYDYMSLVVRLTLARALVNKDKEIKLYNFLYNLSYINLLEPNLSLESVKELQDDIYKTNILNIKRLKRIK